MLNAIQMGILTSSTKERLEALEEQRKELQARIAEERLAKPKMKEEFVRFWLLRFRKLDMTQPEQRQALVDTFINAIYLYDDKVLITFNYKEGTETVAFGEAVKAEKSSDMSARGAPSKQSGLFSGSGLLYFCCKSYLCVLREMLAQKVGADAPAHRVDIDIIEIIRAVILAADFSVQRLLFLHLFEHLLTGRDQGKRPAAGFCLGSSAQKYAV